jgi:pilus assembly protein CpaF
MFYVVISEKGGSQKRLEFDKKEITIGRVQGNDIIFPKGNVSKRHSRIVLKDGKFIIVDLKSTNGTFVNGRKITSPQMIKSSDRIYIGDFTLSVEEFEGESGNIANEEAPPAPAPLAVNPPVPSPSSAPPPPLPPSPRQPSTAGAPVIPRGPAAPPLPESRAPMSSPTPPPSIKPVVVSSNGAAPASTSGKLNNGALVSAKTPVVSRTTPKPAETVKPRSSPVVPVVVAPAAPRRAVKVSPLPVDGDPRAEYLRAKGFILEKLAEQMDTTSTAKPTPALIDSTKKKITELLRAHKASTGAVTNSAQFTDEVCEEALGLGPLKALLQNEQITEILVNGPYQITTVIAGSPQPETVAFGSELGLECAIDRLLTASGYSLSAEPTTVDVKLRSGVQLLAMFPPFSPKGATLSLQRGPVPQSSLPALVADETLPEGVAAFLEVCIRGRISIFISGSAESGRSLLLQSLSSSFAPDERVGVLSDGASLSLQHPQSFVLHQSLASRALQLGATRLLVQNLTLENTGSLLKVLSSMTDGALASGSGQNTQEAFERLCAHAHLAFPMAMPESIREMVGRAFFLMIHTMRFSDGSKRVVQISEVCQVADAEGNATYAPSDLFVWDGERLASTKQAPQFWPLLEVRGEASGNAFFE